MASASLQTVILTREAEDNAELAALLSDAGFAVEQYPCIETHYLRSPAPDFSVYDAIVFSSRRAVRGAFMNADANSLSSRTLAVIGSGGAKELELYGQHASIIADPPDSASLARRLCAMSGAFRRVLNIRGDLGLNTLRDRCTGAGIEVSDWIVYRNVAPKLAAFDGQADYVVFASPSAADRFSAANPGLLHEMRCVAIGPTTLAALEKLDASSVRMARGVEANDILECLLEWRSENETQL